MGLARVHIGMYVEGGFSLRNPKKVIVKQILGGKDLSLIHILDVYKRQPLNLNGNNRKKKKITRHSERDSQFTGQ